MTFCNVSIDNLSLFNLTCLDFESNVGDFFAFWYGSLYLKVGLKRKDRFWENWYGQANL